MEKSLVKNDHNLVWLDMEMSGLNVEKDRILEIAVVITDKELNILTESPSYAIYQPDEVLNSMDKWNTSIHTKSGLVERVRKSQCSISQVEQELLNLIKQYVNKNTTPLCGNTIHHDRKFVLKYMPNLEEYLHYRNLDVSTIKELAKRWYPEICTGFIKHNKHEALADIHESINELKYYRKKLFITNT